MQIAARKRQGWLIFGTQCNFKVVAYLKQYFYMMHEVCLQTNTKTLFSFNFATVTLYIQKTQKDIIMQFLKGTLTVLMKAA